MDDSSNAFASAVALTGVSSIAPGRSVVFTEGDKAAAFEAAWFGANVPAGFAIGSYSGSGVGLSTDGDAVNVFDAAGERVAGVSFGASTTGFTFDNAAGAATVSTLSVAGRNGAFAASGATGSPGAFAAPREETSGDAVVDGSVPTQLALSLGSRASLGAFIAGQEKDYTAELSATVISTAGGAALSVADASATAPGHLVNGAFPLPQALQASVGGRAYSAISGSPATLLTYTGPVTGDQVAVGFKQRIGAGAAAATPRR